PRAPPISGPRAGWERFLRSLPRFVWKGIGQPNIRRRLSPTICSRFPCGPVAATTMALRGPPTTAAHITAGPTLGISPACLMYAAFTVTAIRLRVPQLQLAPLSLHEVLQVTLVP